MEKSIYKIQIEMVTIPLYIGKDLELVTSINDAVPVTFEEHILVMESLGQPAVAYKVA